MTFFNENGLEELFKKVGDICLDELMISSDSYVKMIEFNMRGYKKLHRHLSKEFHDFYLELQRECYENTNVSLPPYTNYSTYNPKNMEQHLKMWHSKLKEHYTIISEVIVKMFSITGCVPCVIKEIQQILYFNIIKTKETIKRLEDCGWEYSVLYHLDNKLCNKMKGKE